MSTSDLDLTGGHPLISYVTLICRRHAKLVFAASDRRSRRCPKCGEVYAVDWEQGSIRTGRAAEGCGEARKRSWR